MSITEQVKHLEGAEWFYRQRANFETSLRNKAYWLNKAIEKKEKIQQLNEIS
jgi:hypothetical protein